ncbi:MAG: alpha/beta hydrolase [Planctomycetaceae bacterium]
MRHRSPAAAAVLVLLTAVLCSGSVRAAEPLEIPLWKNRAPGVAADERQEIVTRQDPRIGRRVTRVTRPVLTVYRPKPDQDTGTAVIICPGGGYNILALDLEGVEVARWLNGIGVTGLVVQYRVPRSRTLPKHALPLKDAQRAIRLARHHSAEWKIRSDRIGMLGFSAGGHLTAVAGTQFSTASVDQDDPLAAHSCRPDFLMLIYPAYLNAPGSETQLSSECSVHKNTPPTLMIHTADDGISATNSIAFFLALKRAKIPAELHIYPSGGHGYGLRTSRHAVSSWPDRARHWLDGQGLLTVNNPR